MCKECWPFQAYPHHLRMYKQPASLFHVHFQRLYDSSIIPHLLLNITIRMIFCRTVSFLGHQWTWINLLETHTGTSKLPLTRRMELTTCKCRIFWTMRMKLIVFLYTALMGHQTLNMRLTSLLNLFSRLKTSWDAHFHFFEVSDSPSQCSAIANYLHHVE